MTPGELAWSLSRKNCRLCKTNTKANTSVCSRRHHSHPHYGSGLLIALSRTCCITCSSSDSIRHPCMPGSNAKYERKEKAEEKGPSRSKSTSTDVRQHFASRRYPQRRYSQCVPLFIFTPKPCFLSTPIPERLHDSVKIVLIN